MRYLPDSKALFLHIPRTGGVWVNKALNVLQIKHNITWRKDIPIKIPRNHQLILHLPIKRLCSVSFRFAFVRHPIAYYESVWKWLNVGIQMRRHWKWHPFLSAHKLYSPDFNQWIRRMLDEESAWYTRLVESYVGPKGGEFVDYIGKTETLSTDLKKVLVKLGYAEQVSKHWAEVEKLQRIHEIKQNVQWNMRLKKRILATECLVIKRFYE